MRSKKGSKLYSLPFILMASANLFTVSSFGCFYFFSLFITEHGGSKADIGLIMGALTFASVLCRPLISELIDKIGRKKCYTIGCLIMSIMPCTYLLVKGELTYFFFHLILIRFLHGVGLAICFTASFTYIADIVPERRLNEGIGIFGLSGLTGMAIGPVIGETIIREFGFSTFFLTAAGLATLGLLLQLPIPESYVHVSRGASSQSFFSVLIKRKILSVALLASLFGFGFAASGSFVSPFAQERQLEFISLYYLSYSSAAVLTRLLGGSLADRIGENRIIPHALLLTGGGLLMLIFLGGTTILVVAGLMSGCGHGFLYPCLNALVIRDEPVHIRGKVTGIFTGGIDAGAFVGAIILGYIGEWAGYRALFFAAGLALLTGLWIHRIQMLGDTNDS